MGIPQAAQKGLQVVLVRVWVTVEAEEVDLRFP
jgi:hypothetical protein